MVRCAPGPAVGAGVQAVGQQAAGFVAVDGVAAGAEHVAVAGVQLDGRAPGPDTDLDDPVGCRRPVPAAVLDFGLPPLKGRDLRVNALHPQHMPGTQRVQAIQVGRQVIEHIFDSMPKIRRCHPCRAGVLCHRTWPLPPHLDDPRIRATEV
jgi:hypothetical protein